MSEHRPPAGIDPVAIDGKFAEVEARAGLLVVGGGPAGLAAAIEGARLGLATLLVDENPIDPALIGSDVPLAFGQRATGAVRQRGRLVEQLVQAEPLIERAFEAGVDVRLGASAWGLYVPSAQSRALPGIVAGLEDGERSWLVGCDHVILATGARDLMAGFDGWQLPGVIGATALRLLVERYDACAVERMVVLGSSDWALETALVAARHGIAVAAVVEPGPEPLASPALCDAARAAGIALLCGHVIAGAEGGTEGIARVRLRTLEGGAERAIDCDSVCVAIARLPNVELAASAGAALRFDAAAGGWRPLLDGARTSIAGVQAVGACAGLGRSREAVLGHARAAAQAAAARMDIAAAAEADPPRPLDWPEPARWMAALAESGGADVLACLCEQVTRRELLDLSPPRYLEAPGAHAALLAPPPDMDRVKRITRCGMGECQGRRCREQAALLVAADSGVAPGAIPPPSYRAPVRPLPLRLLADDGETEAMRAHWTSWFGIPSQWTPHWLLGSEADGIGGEGHL